MNYEKNVYLCRYEKDVINIVGCSSCRWSRNFDGNYGEMVVVFNHNVKPGEHKSVMMTDLKKDI